MPGAILRVVPKSTFDYTGLSTMGPSLLLLGAKGVDISQEREINVTVRLHSTPIDQYGNPWPSGSQLTVSARLDAPTDEDSQNDFTTTNDLGYVAFYQGTDTGPTVKVFSISPPLTPFIRIYVKGQLTQSWLHGFVATISVDVNVKS